MKTITHLRNSEFIRACRRIARAEQGNHIPLTTRRLAVLAVYSRASSYYISYARAYNLVLDYLKLDEVARERLPHSSMATRTRHLATEAERVAASKGVSLRAALTAVVAGGAPRFYISIPYAMRLINRYLPHRVLYRTETVLDEGGASC